MSLVERLEVPLPKSDCSTRQTLYPRDAASTAMPTPVAPPPMTIMFQLPACAVIRCRDRPRSIDPPCDASVAQPARVGERATFPQIAKRYCSRPDSASATATEGVGVRRELSTQQSCR